MRISFLPSSLWSIKCSNESLLTIRLAGVWLSFKRRHNYPGVSRREIFYSGVWCAWLATNSLILSDFHQLGVVCNELCWWFLTAPHSVKKDKQGAGDVWQRHNYRNKESWVFTVARTLLHCWGSGGPRTVSIIWIWIIGAEEQGKYEETEGSKTWTNISLKFNSQVGKFKS